MGSHVKVFAVFAVGLLLTHCAIISVEGQCTVEGCENEDPSIGFEAAMEKLRVELFSHVNKQVQNIRHLLISSFQQLKCFHECAKIESRNVWDCSDIKASGQTTSGVYEVCVWYQLNRICTNAFCEMETTNGPWTVFQKRINGSEDFFRTWGEYKEGFGDRKGEFWLGNEMLYLLTSKRNYKLRIDLEDFEGAKRHAEYTRFSISSSADNYKLAVSGYSGDAGDSLTQHSGQQFSTKDLDNDQAGGRNCASYFRAAWWYDNCGYSNLNGIYHRSNYSSSTSGKQGIQWSTWPGRWFNTWYSLKSTVMKLAPVA